MGSIKASTSHLYIYQSTFLYFRKKLMRALLDILERKMQKEYS